MTFPPADVENGSVVPSKKGLNFTAVLKPVRSVAVDAENGINFMDIFGAGAKAGECRLLAVDASGERRDRLLALADEYDLIHETLMRLQVEQLRFSGDDPIPQIAQDE